MNKLTNILKQALPVVVGLIIYDLFAKDVVMELFSNLKGNG